MAYTQSRSWTLPAYPHTIANHHVRKYSRIQQIRVMQHNTQVLLPSDVLQMIGDWQFATTQQQLQQAQAAVATLLRSSYGGITHRIQLFLGRRPHPLCNQDWFGQFFLPIIQSYGNAIWNPPRHRHAIRMDSLADYLIITVADDTDSVAPPPNRHSSTRASSSASTAAGYSSATSSTTYTNSTRRQRRSRRG
jgi:hypothetical protein